MFLRLSAAALAVFTLVVAPVRAADRPLRPAASPEAVGFSSERLKRLDAAMAGAVDRGEVVGMQTMLARHGQIAAFRTHGLMDAAGNRPMSRDAIVRIYSQSKPITGLAMMILFEEGKWRLEDPVTKHIPELAGLKLMTGVDAQGKAIVADLKRPPTMRELMTHTAGFGYGLGGDDPVNAAFRDQHVLQSQGMGGLIANVAGIPLLYPPGERWSYSVAVDLQGYIVEKLSGMPLGEFMKTRIFQPLKMNDTAFMVPAEKINRLASVYVWDPEAKALRPAPLGGMVQDFTKPPTFESGGGGLVSTIDDYARFAQMILNEGELDGARILSPAGVRMFTSNQLPRTLKVNEDGTLTGGYGDATGFALDFAVVMDPAQAGTLAPEGTVSWGGAAGTWFWIDPKSDLFFLGMIQRYRGVPGGVDFTELSQTLVYQALVDPEK